MADKFKKGQIVDIKCTISGSEYSSNDSPNYYFVSAPNGAHICISASELNESSLRVKDATDDQLIEELKRRGRVLADMTRKK